MAKGPPGLNPVVRDVVLLAGGMLGVGYQQVTGDVNWVLIATYLTMLGVPGLSNGIWLLRLLLKEDSESPSRSSPSPPSQSGSSQQSEVSRGD